jgi:hypothetical protein
MGRVLFFLVVAFAARGDDDKLDCSGWFAAMQARANAVSRRGIRVRCHRRRRALHRDVPIAASRGLSRDAEALCPISSPRGRAALHEEMAYQASYAARFAVSFLAFGCSDKGTESADCSEWLRMLTSPPPFVADAGLSNDIVVVSEYCLATYPPELCGQRSP